MEMVEPMDPEMALCQVFEYVSKHAMTQIIITADLNQRVNSVGDITIYPINTDIEALDLEDVYLPNWVVAHARRIVTYPVEFFRVNINE